MNQQSRLPQGVIYTGVDDTDIDLFESQYDVPEGMSYNSYVILDEKIAVTDTVDLRKVDEWLSNVDKALNGKKPDYLIIHHMEPDHSGSIAKFIAKYPDTTVVGSSKALAMMSLYFEDTVINHKQEVKEGDNLALGKHNLTFIAAPMVHWPEVMLSFETTDGTLFAADAFGKFGAIQHETDDWACEARRYYFNICGKYGAPVQTLLKKAAKLNIKTICPLHGPVLNSNLEYYINLYNIWSSYGVETPGVLVAYASIHGGTKAAALKLAEMLEAKGCPKVATADLTRDDMEEAIEDAFRMDTTVLAASSYDAGVFPPMEDFLNRLQHKAFQNRRIAIVENGSWAPSAARTMAKLLEPMKNIELIPQTVTIKGRMHKEDIPNFEALAETIAAKYKN
ncbi:MAG: FprA family A-type flavoprotein [Bacteroidales bacterium]|nr:FprA family A-type flavoprotein [Bacteroidales bacterium]